MLESVLCMQKMMYLLNNYYNGLPFTLFRRFLLHISLPQMLFFCFYVSSLIRNRKEKTWSLTVHVGFVIHGRRIESTSEGAEDKPLWVWFWIGLATAEERTEATIICPAAVPREAGLLSLVPYFRSVSTFSIHCNMKDLDRHVMAQIKQCSSYSSKIQVYKLHIFSISTVDNSPLRGRELLDLQMTVVQVHLVLQVWSNYISNWGLEGYHSLVFLAGHTASTARAPATPERGIYISCCSWIFFSLKSCFNGAF